MSDEVKTVPFFCHESEVCRQERTIRRMWIMALVALAITVLTNAGWVVWVLSTR